MQLVCFFMAWIFQRKFLLRRTKTVTFQTKSCTHVGIPYSNCDGNLSVFLFNYENWRRVRDAFFAASRKFHHSILQSHAMTRNTNVSTMSAMNIVVFGWVLIIKFRQKLDENMIRMVIVSSSLALFLFTWKLMFKMWSKQINATKPMAKWQLRAEKRFVHLIYLDSVMCAFCFPFSFWFHICSQRTLLLVFFSYC